MTAVNEENLLENGYREYPPNQIDSYKTLFQKAIYDEEDRLYFINFREWHHSGFDAQLCCETDTKGHAWITLKEDDIQTVENRCADLWSALGGMRYDN